MGVFICMLLGLPGDSELEIGRVRTPSLRILQFIHTLQQQGPFIHTDPLSLCEWRAECIKVCQLLSQNQRPWSYFISMLQWKFVKWAQGDLKQTAGWKWDSVEESKRGAGIMTSGDKAMIATSMLSVKLSSQQTTFPWQKSQSLMGQAFLLHSCCNCYSTS